MSNDIPPSGTFNVGRRFTDVYREVLTTVVCDSCQNFLGKCTCITDEAIAKAPICSECKGTGQYNGLISVEICKTCGGKGYVVK